MNEEDIENLAISTAEALVAKGYLDLSKVNKVESWHNFLDLIQNNLREIERERNKK